MDRSNSRIHEDPQEGISGEQTIGDSQQKEVVARLGWWRRGKDSVKNYVFNDVLGATDSAHRIALGVAIGMIVTFTPTIPFQMALTVFLSWIFRANKVVGVPLVWITNPATAVPIYFGQYMLGAWVLNISPENVDFGIFGEEDRYNSLLEYVKAAWGLMEQVFWPLWVGSFIIGFAVGVPTYLITRWAIHRYNRHA